MICVTILNATVKSKLLLLPIQFQLEGGSIKSKLQKNFKGSQTAWNKFLKPALNIASPYIGMAVSARTKNPQIGQATSDILNQYQVVRFYH